MGSFNVACSVSNISIGAGDPVAYIPLEVARYPYKIGDGNDMLIYTHCFYAPVTLPIFGLYDDYGGVENIEKNRNTDIIEKYFGAHISEIIRRDLPDTRIVNTISSGMFVHRKIYDTMVNKCSQIGEWGNISSPIFAEPRDDPMMSLTNDLEKYIEEIKKASREYKEHRDFLNNLGKERKPFWKTMNSIIKSPIKHIEYIKRAKKLRKLSASMAETDKEPHNFFLASVSSIFGFREYGAFNDIYQPKMLQGELKDEIIEFVLFECGMGATNNFYFPAMNGYQCGNLYASKILYWESLKIVIKDILHQKYHWLTPHELKWTIKYRAKRYWKKLWQR